MKSSIIIRDKFGDEATLSIGIRHLQINTLTEDALDAVLLDLPQSKKLSKWLKKAIKELEKREAEGL